MSNYRWPLMQSAIGDDEKQALIDFVSSTDRFTNGPKVREFEAAWARWQGCEYALFVSSGSTANMMMLSLLNPGATVATPACTWATNVSSMYQLGLRPVFYDIDRYTYSPTPESLVDLSRIQPDAIMVTHLMGLANDMDAIREALGDAVIIEDCCESHGATFDSRKVGNFGMASSFSFYYGHHMTTIEGGMICTDDEWTYQRLRAIRSHGMTREMDGHFRSDQEAANPHIDPRFLFVEAGFNARNTEIGAVLGLTQLPKLDDFIRIRRLRYRRFLEILGQYPEHFDIPAYEGNSSMTLPIHCRDPELASRLKATLEESGIETRPFLVGNLMVQPFVRSRSGQHMALDLPITERIHASSLYIGNSQFVTEDDMDYLEEVIASVVS